MSTIIYNARLIQHNGILEHGGIAADEGRITNVFAGEYKPGPGDRLIDAEGRYLSPGFIDSHMHGGGGADAMDGTEEAVIHMAEVHARHGLTAFLPTTLTASVPAIQKACAAITGVMNKTHSGAAVLGIHLEGPFISLKYKGAQNPAHIQKPSVDAYLTISNGGEQVRRVSMAPEVEGALELASYLSKRGILVSAAHTDADYAAMCAGLKAGFTHVTHCFNGMSGVQSPDYYCHAGTIESALELDGYSAEIIGDGKHMPPEMIRLLMKCKRPEQVMLTTDSTRPADMPKGEYELGGLPVLVTDGVAMLADRSAFAGSIATMDILVRNAVKNAGIPLHQAVAMVSYNTARSLGIQNERGSLEKGMIADAVLFDDDIHVSTVMREGTILFDE